MAFITWTETALKDIDAIAEFIALDSPFSASKFVNKLFAATIKLEKYPEIGRTVPELPGYTYREILLKKYRIIYRINNDDVFIISVHHSARLLSNSDTFKDLFE